jgi:sugar lactone lactonase YvrE
MAEAGPARHHFVSACLERPVIDARARSPSFRRRGKSCREIYVLGKQPTNLCFGGPEGKTVYVTEVSKQRLVAFRVDQPGLAWQRWQEK